MKKNQIEMSFTNSRGRTISEKEKEAIKCSCGNWYTVGENCEWCEEVKKYTSYLDKWIQNIKFECLEIIINGNIDNMNIYADYFALYKNSIKRLNDVLDTKSEGIILAVEFCKVEEEKY